MDRPGDRIQRQLSEYLQCELDHVLGAYGLAAKRLLVLEETIQAAEVAASGGTSSSTTALHGLVKMSRLYNDWLGIRRYASIPIPRPGSGKEWPTREPLPEFEDEFPLSNKARFSIDSRNEGVDADKGPTWANQEQWSRIPRFYSEAIEALEAYEDIVGSTDDSYIDPGEGESTEINRRNFARGLVAARDGVAESLHRGAARERLERRLYRYRHRRKTAISDIGSREKDNRHLEHAEPEDEKKLLKSIIESDLDDEDASLPIFVLRAHAEAHISMHAVEAWRSMCLGEHANAAGRKEREWLDQELDRSIGLSTFAYCVSRTAPWIFAKNEKERKGVMRDVAMAWENLVPTRCMWIASQISLLSLHRRAYAHALKDDTTGAYNDYHKLQQLIRDTERRVRAAPLHVEGALLFLAGLNAEAHHHIGELYRSQHAHRPALQHFKAATHRLQLLRKEGKGSEVLANSRWNVELQISHGKACYEMGRHKEALYWHLQAWRAFLELLSSETTTKTNTENIEKALEWLDSVRFEPELRKSEISEWVGPVVEQLDRITMVGRVGALAAEILLRLGHLLFVLNIGYPDDEEMDEKPAEGTDEPADPADIRAAWERISKTLALPCLLKASECDPYSTLVGADLLKTRFRFNKWRQGGLSPAYKDNLELPMLERIESQWPRGGDDFERLARVAEYLMLKARMGRFEDEALNKGDDEEAEALLARDLLLDLFMSTDSINVRKSQIHRFLMLSTPNERLPRDHKAPAIEFICMRRYSSPFPLLPRPSAFRALGGGYFLRLHDKSMEGPRGIVVDPGVDFVENLYRSGYALSDIDMIVITHDHVDHLGGLDPLLSLLHVRSQVLSKQPEPDGTEPAEAKRKIKVLMSRSVDWRYDGVVHLAKMTKKSEFRESENFQFACFEDLIENRTGVLRSRKFFKDFPSDFEIVAMSSVAGAVNEEEGGHRDLSNEASHGFCFRVAGGGGPSVAITSDTPPPPPSADDARYARWREVWGPALAADVLVVHLGSVPLTELRRMDPRAENAELAEEEANLLDLQGKLQDADKHLRGQVEYAHWLRSHDPEQRRGRRRRKDLTAPLVGAVSEKWLPPPEHNYLVGLLRWAREYRGRWPAGTPSPNGQDRVAGIGRQGLFVVGELSEELGTMRGKVATRLNDRVFDAGTLREELQKGEPNAGPCAGIPYALTADIGLHACVTPDGEGGSRVEVLCTTCNLDTDRSPEERYHAAHDVYEVCVKGENEGIFYNCLEHDPARQDEPAFLERLERFDIFGR
jgi:hypothetical protein